MKAANYQYWDYLPKDRYIFRDMEHYFIKIYGRFAVDYKNRNVNQNTQYARLRVEQVFGDPSSKNLLPANSLLQDRELLSDILYKYYALSGIRNTINHALKDQDDLENAPMIESRIWNDVGRMIGEFIECYQKILDTINGLPFEQVPITQEEFRSYTFDHGPKSDPNYRNVPGYNPLRCNDNPQGRRQNRRRENDARQDSRSYDRQRNDLRSSGRTHPVSQSTSPAVPAATVERPNINIVVSVSRGKSICGFFKKIFGGKASEPNSSSDVTVDNTENSGEGTQTSKGDINIHITID